MIDLESIPYVPCRDQWPRRTSARHIWIVLHSIEGSETPMSAENCAAYFQNPPRVASTQFVVDVDSTIRCADWESRCAAAVGANDEGWHIEQAGQAGQDDGWNDEYSTRMILNQTAPLVAALSIRDEIPLEFVDAAGLQQRRPGVTTHHECWKAFGGDVRTDPGRYYPMDRMLAAARRIATPIKPTTPPEEDTIMPRAVYELEIDHKHHKRGETWVELPNGDLVYHEAPGLLAKQLQGDAGHPAHLTAIYRTPIKVTPGEMEYVIRQQNGDEAADAWKG
jgi:hypothetical protein